MIMHINMSQAQETEEQVTFFHGLSYSVLSFFGFSSQRGVRFPPLLFIQSHFFFLLVRLCFVSSRGSKDKGHVSRIGLKNQTLIYNNMTLNFSDIFFVCISFIAPYGNFPKSGMKIKKPYSFPTQLVSCSSDQSSLIAISSLFLKEHHSQGNKTSQFELVIFSTNRMVIHHLRAQ